MNTTVYLLVRVFPDGAGVEHDDIGVKLTLDKHTVLLRQNLFAKLGVILVHLPTIRFQKYFLIDGLIYHIVGSEKRMAVLGFHINVWENRGQP